EYTHAGDDIAEFNEWTRILAILRLYTVADVKFNSATLESQGTYPYYDGVGETGHFGDDYAIFGGILNSQDGPELSKFWRTIEPHIPNSFKVPESEHDQLTIAYQRYLEAMNNPGMEEMRIAYGISSLEALFSVEHTEMNYRLKMRVSRLLGILGLNPKAVYDAIDWAYDARSAFDHGDKLSSKKKQKIRQFYNAKGERILTLIILDYVRICIITALLTNWNKEVIVKLIDDSWVSSESLMKLKKILRKPKALLRLKSYKPEYSLAPFNDSLCSCIIRET
ncbi:MAG: hypothetical protein ACREBU_16350, partial [Nitrososphaera sp.]